MKRSENFREISGILLGTFRELSRKCSRHFQEISRTFPKTKCPRSSQDTFGSFPGQCRELSPTCHGHFREVFGTCPNNFQEMSGKCPANVLDNPFKGGCYFPTTLSKHHDHLSISLIFLEMRILNYFVYC